MRSQSIASSVSSHLSTKYATTAREGTFLQLKVREVKHSPAGKIEPEKRRKNSADSNISSLSSKLPTVFREYRTSDSQRDCFPSDRIDNKTLAFVDQKLDRDYRIHTAKKALFLCTLISVLGFLFNGMLVVGAIILSWDGIFISIGSMAVSGGCLYILLYVKWNIHKETKSARCSKLYFFYHGAIFFYCSTIFSFITFLDENWALGVSQLLIMGMTIVIPGDYPAQIGMTVYTNFLPTILLLISTQGSFSILFRCIAPLLITSVISVALLRITETQRKHSFYAMQKLKWIKAQVAETRNRTKFLLHNLYPRPIVNAITQDSMATPSYQCQECSAICVLISAQELTSHNLKKVVKDIEKLYGTMLHVANSYGIHKVNSTGIKKNKY